MLTRSLATILLSKISENGSFEKGEDKKSLDAEARFELATSWLWAKLPDLWMTLQYVEEVRVADWLPQSKLLFLLVRLIGTWDYSSSFATSLVTLCVSHFIHFLLESNAHACIFVIPPQELQVCDLPLTNAYSIIFPLPTLRAALGCYANIVSIQSNIWCLWHHISLIAYLWGLKTLFVIRNNRFLLLTHFPNNVALPLSYRRRYGELVVSVRPLNSFLGRRTGIEPALS